MVLNITSLRNSDIERFEVAPGDVIHGAVSEWNVIFLDLGDDFDAISALKLNGDNEIQAGAEQLGHQHSVSERRDRGLGTNITRGESLIWVGYHSLGHPVLCHRKDQISKII